MLSFFPLIKFVYSLFSDASVSGAANSQIQSQTPHQLGQVHIGHGGVPIHVVTQRPQVCILTSWLKHFE